MSRRARHRYERAPIYWRFTYRYYRNQWWFFTKPRLKREVSDIVATIKLLLK